MKKITAFFGGSFDPPHTGHLGVARGALQSGFCQKVIWVPAWSQPHKQGKKTAPYHHRLAMVEWMIKDEKNMAVSDLERRLQLQPSYTFDVLKYFASELPEEEKPALLIGADSLLQLHTWHEAVQLARQYTILTYPRPGREVSFEALAPFWPEKMVKKLLSGVMEGSFFEISSTEIRNSMAKSAETDNINKGNNLLISDRIREYCRKNGLYEE